MVLRTIGLVVVLAVVVSTGCADDVKVNPYATVKAIQTADNMLLWQRSSGGWPKNVKMDGSLSEATVVALNKSKSRRDATFDNGATHRQMRHLARVYTATKHARFKTGFIKGLDYVLAAQYANGGFPQIPGGRGYSQHITFNDGAMVGVLSILRDVAEGRKNYVFVDPIRRKRCATAAAKGLACILKCQVIVKGKPTVWGQQHDRKTLKPAPARSFEPVSLCTAESVGVVRYLMSIDKPSAGVIAAIEGAVAWFEKVKITGIRQKIVEVKPIKHRFHTSTKDKVLVSDPTAPALWARLYEIGTNKPIYGDRDGKVHYALAEISRERRTGYSWLSRWPARLLAKEYPVWQVKHALDSAKSKATVSP